MWGVFRRNLLSLTCLLFCLSSYRLASFCSVLLGSIFRGLPIRNRNFSNLSNGISESTLSFSAVHIWTWFSHPHLSYFSNYFFHSICYWLKTYYHLYIEISLHYQHLFYGPSVLWSCSISSFWFLCFYRFSLISVTL